MSLLDDEVDEEAITYAVSEPVVEVLLLPGVGATEPYAP